MNTGKRRQNKGQPAGHSAGDRPRTRPEAAPAALWPLWEVVWLDEDFALRHTAIRAATREAVIAELWRVHPHVAFLSAAIVPEIAAQAATLHSGAERRPGEAVSADTTIDTAAPPADGLSAPERKRIAGEHRRALGRP